MAAEFYHKTASLFEEFKKREFHCLNTDKRIKSNLNWKSDFNMSTQDYLQKVNKREKETEQTYRELMKHMEDLDRKTDQMSLKLEKLHALRNIAISSNSATWPSVDNTFDSPLQSFHNRTFIHNPSTIMPSISATKAFHSMSVSEYSTSKLHSCDESTQTDDMLCAHCHFPFVMYPKDKSDASKIITSTNDNAFLLQGINKNIQLPHSKESCMQSIASTVMDNTVESYIDDHNIANIGFENLKEGLNVNEDIPYKINVPKENNASTEVPTLKFANDVEICEESEVYWSKSDVHNIDTNEKDSVDENIEGSTGTIEPTVSKSDDESMNHEFDFLESDKRSSIKSADTQLVVPNLSNQSKTKTDNLNVEDKQNTTLQENSLSSMTISSVPAEVPDFKKHQEPVSETPYLFAENMERIKINEDLKPDSSVSGGHSTPPFHSENASLASESDSLSEKETPLTATAAYQALLGNVSTSKTAQKRQQVSYSDSEDEIENALATAVRKSSNVTFETSGPSLKTEDRKESIVEAKLKTETKTSISASKPQTKLSKSTRKVLGLDTSSGSEVELAVEASVNKKAEDSDEFDFYD